MKAFIFEAFTQNKVFGSTQAPVEMIVVKNADTKAAARELAEKHVTKGLRIVYAGTTFKTASDAVEYAGKWCARYTDSKSKCVWFAVDAKPTENNIRLQRQLAKLIGLTA